MWTKREASADGLPDHPCHAAAAKVGGIQANNTYPADFLLDNLKIQTNVIEAAWRAGVRRLLAKQLVRLWPGILLTDLTLKRLRGLPSEPSDPSAGTAL